ncbi:MAG: hypothetical protein JW862_10280 [Anaerolineales bacterium]|nr:hypothetical protein [Anaerolineales bacterium]
MAVSNSGMLIQARCRLWRVDSQQDSVLFLTAVDGTTLQTHLYLPHKPVQTGKLQSPKPDILGTPQAQELMVSILRLSMMHITAPLLSLQRSRSLPIDYSLNRCTACGKRVLGYKQVNHTRQVHAGKDPGYVKIG